MRYFPLTSNFYSNNRANFIDSISKGGIAVFNSNDIYPISADSTMPFQQHRDIFYLTGIDKRKLFSYYSQTQKILTIEKYYL